MTHDDTVGTREVAKRGSRVTAYNDATLVPCHASEDDRFPSADFATGRGVFFRPKQHKRAS